MLFLISASSNPNPNNGAAGFLCPAKLFLIIFKVKRSTLIQVTTSSFHIPSNSSVTYVVAHVDGVRGCFSAATAK
jgi:hypothetical protein